MHKILEFILRPFFNLKRIVIRRHSVRAQITKQDIEIRLNEIDNKTYSHPLDKLNDLLEIMRNAADLYLTDKAV